MGGGAHPPQLGHRLMLGTQTDTSPAGLFAILSLEIRVLNPGEFHLPGPNASAPIAVFSHSWI